MVLELHLKETVSRPIDEGCGKGITRQSEESIKSSKYNRKHNQGVLEASEGCWDILNKGGNQVEK